MNTQEVLARKGPGGLLAATLIALFLSACAPNMVSGTAIGSPTEAASSTLAPTTSAARPPSAFDDGVPDAENPYKWVTQTPYSGTLDVDGLDLDLRDPIPEAHDTVDAVAFFGTRCVVTLSGQYGMAPTTFGVMIYRNPKNLSDWGMSGPLDASAANLYVHEYDELCDT